MSVFAVSFSGAGKTSLLNVIARRTSPTEGTVWVNKKPADKTFTRISSYVQQEDLFLPSLTVREHLRFQMDLKLGEAIGDDEKERRVDNLISALGLRKVKNSMIGSPQGKRYVHSSHNWLNYKLNRYQNLGTHCRGISAGEKKRLSVASEIITNPSLLFADEPTSGLDSYMAESIVKLLKKLARAGKHAMKVKNQSKMNPVYHNFAICTGRTVITTIHQPSSEVYHMFDKLLLIREGEIVYFGEKDEAISYFEQIDPWLKCPQYSNPADFFLRALSVFSEKHSRYELVSWLGEIWRKSELNKKMLQSSDTGTFSDGTLIIEEDGHGAQPYVLTDAEETSDEETKSRYPISKFKQFRVLLSRALSILHETRY